MRIRDIVGATVLSLCAIGTAHAQQPCGGTAATLQIRAESDIVSMALPNGHRNVAVHVEAEGGLTPLDPPITAVVPAAESEWKMQVADVTTIRGILTARDAKQLVLVWSGAPAQPACTTALEFGGGGGPDNDPDKQLLPKTDMTAPASKVAWQAGDCAEAGRRWETDIRRERRALSEGGARGYTALIFAEDQGVCFRSRDYGVTGDPIYVAVFTNQPQNWNGLSASFDPCAAEAAAPNVFASGTLPTAPGSRQKARPHQLRTYLPRRCFNTAVDITVQSTGADPKVTARYNLTQAERYRAGLQVGTIFTDLVDHSFGLRTVRDSSVIYDKGPTNSGPEYFATVVFYSILRYVPSLFGGERYLGRDIIHDQSPIDRVGLVLGTGLRHPADRFLAGASLEILPGVNVVAAHQTAKVRRLADVRAGDVFGAAEDRIPTRDRWENGWTYGLSIDLRYATSLLKR
jgi:hypothetical protein